MKIEKFPKLYIGDKKIVWDSRQLTELAKKEINFLFHEDQKDRPELSFCYLPKLFPDELSYRNFFAKQCHEAVGKASEKFKVIGVTGTNGKSSCVHIIRSLLVKKFGRIAQLGTEGLSVWEDGKKILDCELGWTTPEAPVLHNICRYLFEQGVNVLVLEISSHGLELARIGGLDIDAALFTNLSQDHLDFHSNMESYYQAKKKLFSFYLKEDATALINIEEEFSQRLFNELKDKRKNLLSLDQSFYKFKAKSLDGSKIILGDGRLIETNLIGDYNLRNLCCSLQLLEVFLQKKLFEDQKNIQINIPGRLNLVSSLGPKVFVDFAHSQNSLELVLKELKTFKSREARLIVVFGCGGDRDRKKRSFMGEVAAAHSDQIILTNDNPRTEDPLKIIADIELGLKKSHFDEYKIIVNRKQAIEEALKAACAEDIVLVAGKGNENYQVIGKEKFKFSDRNEILKLTKS